MPLHDGLRHLVIYPLGDHLVTAAVGALEEYTHPAGPLAAARSRLLILAAGNGNAVQQPTLPGEQRRPAHEALAHLARHTPEPVQGRASRSRPALQHIVITADRAGQASRVGTFAAWASTFGAGELERIPIVWILSRLAPSELLAEMEPMPDARTVILPARLGHAQLDDSQRAEMAGLVLADALATDLGGPRSSFLAEFIQPRPPIVLGARAARAGAAETLEYITAKVMADAVKRALTCEKAADSEEEALSGELLRDLLSKQARIIGPQLKTALLSQEPSLLERLTPEVLLSLEPEDRARMLQAAYRRLHNPRTGSIPRMLRDIRVAYDSEADLGIEEVRAEVSACAGQGPGGPLRALAALRDADAMLSVANEEAESYQQPRFRFPDDMHGILAAGQVVPPTTAIRMLWGGTVGLTAATFAHSEIDGPLWPAVAALLGLLVMYAAFAIPGLRARRRDQAALQRIEERAAAYCIATAQWLADIWIPSRQRQRLHELSLRLGARVDEWRSLARALEARAERLRATFEHSWTYYLVNASVWQAESERLCGLRAADRVFREIVDVLTGESADEDVAGAALLRAQPAVLEAALHAWAASLVAKELRQPPSLHRANPPATVLEILRESASPDSPHVQPLLLGSPDVPLTAAGRAIPLLPTEQEEWVSLWMLGTVEEVSDAHS